MTEEPPTASPASSQLTHAQMADAAAEIVAAGEQAGIKIRAVGGAGIWSQLSPGSRQTYERLRPPPKDIDLLTPAKTSKAVKALFEGLGGYEPDERLIAWHGERRHRYFRVEQGQPLYDVDVFIGKPPLCHEIEFGDRLSGPGFAMAPTDLLLQKLQVHDTTDRDLIDAAYLLFDFPLANGNENDGIDLTRITELTGQDWGFYYATITNLEKVAAAADSLQNGDRATVTERAKALTAAVEEAPKSRRWKLRARVGTKVQWYEDVEELVR